MKRVLILLIRLYQLAISPFFGSCCRFAPSCSTYAIEALQTFGVVKGGWLTLKRLIRCGPWHPGGEDPLPQKRESSEVACDESS